MRDYVAEAAGLDPPAARALPRRHVVAVALGNALEFYDFITYAFFAAQIGRTFFPSDRPGVSLLASLATFGAGFLARPLGAWVIGRMGDRRGRKPAMLLSFGLIGIAVIGLPLTPSYAAIGLWAPVLVVGFRLLQGFALGGEVGPSTAFLMEAAPLMRRGFYISMQAMSADAAVLVAGLVGVLLAHWLSPAALDAWGWRVALGLGAVIVPFGWFMRRSLVETLDVAATRAAAAAPSGPRMAGYRRVALLGLAMLAAATTTNYVLDYMTTYASATLGMPERLALGATVMVGLCGLVCDPLSGWLSDRIGRKPVMVVPWVVLLLAILPAFWLLGRERSGVALFGDRLDIVHRHRAGGGDRIVAGARALRRAGDDLCGGDLGVRRLHPVRGGMAHAVDRQSAGAGLVHDRRGGGGVACDHPGTGDGTGKARANRAIGGGGGGAGSLDAG